MPSHIIKPAQLWMEVYVAGNQTDEQLFANMFVPAECKKASSPESADLVVFTGGPDVNPALYGEEPHSTTRWSDERDADDKALWDYCVANGVPMLGVCRGAQFGAVMKGAKLIQDMDNHDRSHHMWDTKKNLLLSHISSSHHQAVMPCEGMDIMGDCRISDYQYTNKNTKKVGSNADIEAFFFPDVCFFGVQGHPEYKGFTRYALWTIKWIEELIVNNPDIVLMDRVRRIKPEKRVNAEVNTTWKELA